MPLKALLDGHPVLAPLLSDAEWADLYLQRYRLVLPCCPEAAVQLRGGGRTRRIQHFSHAPSPTCAYRGETTAHLRAKVEIARASAEAGWEVDVEHAEGDWRADVLATSGRRRVAFEVQWSHQTWAETEARQARYRAAGVRGCWFVRHPPVEPGRGGGGPAVAARRAVPLFPLTAGRGEETYRVPLEGRTHPLGAVVAALLGGRIAFREHRTVDGELPLEIAFYDKACAACGAPARLYGVAPVEGRPPRSPCGSRVLLWTETLYRSDVADAARRAYDGVAPSGEATHLALVEPGVGFRCPRCRARIAPYLAGGVGTTAVRVTAPVSLTRPLRDPHPHWCYPEDGAFCAPVSAHSG